MLARKLRSTVVGYTCAFHEFHSLSSSTQSHSHHPPPLTAVGVTRSLGLYRPTPLRRYGAGGTLGGVKRLSVTLNSTNYTDWWLLEPTRDELIEPFGHRCCMSNREIAVASAVFRVCRAASHQCSGWHWWLVAII